jgi:Putative transposase
MARPPITSERMLGRENAGQVIYRVKEVHPRHQANFRVFEPLDILAEVSAHIPDAHEKTTLFYGLYSNRTRGYRMQQSARSMR